MTSTPLQTSEMEHAAGACELSEKLSFPLSLVIGIVPTFVQTREERKTEETRRPNLNFLPQLH